MNKENLSYHDIERLMYPYASVERLCGQQRFFKTGRHEYAEGDKFLGIRVPDIRKIVRSVASDISDPLIDTLIASPWHEMRLLGLLILVELYSKAKKEKNEERQKEIVDRYLSKADHINNWDLVDLSAPNILGEWLLEHPEQREILRRLADADDLWRNRIAMVSTLALIRNGQFDEAVELVEKFLNHPHDLMHKAAGWMLREIGKNGGSDTLVAFLEKNASSMPRVMLRYAIERFPEEQRRRFMKL